MDEALNFADFSAKFYFMFVGPNNAPLQLDPRIASFRLQNSISRIDSSGAFHFDADVVEIEEAQLGTNPEVDLLLV